MSKVYNFSAGPSVLPEPVLTRARDELLDYRGAGMSVMEMSHRARVFEDIIEQTESDLRELMAIPDDYHVLFLQGGASTQFAMVPMNLMGADGEADYVNTGVWSKKAIAEARRYGKVNVPADSSDRNFCYAPKVVREKLSPKAAYLHITTNNTIYGTRVAIPECLPDVPLVADMSSNILSQRYDISRFGLIYAGAQKNLGPAGLTVVIIHKALVGKAAPITPTMLDYQTHVESASLYNTPPTYSIYIAGLVLQWLKDKGGLAQIEAENEAKAAVLYQFLDESRLFSGTAERSDRSIMNIPFVSPSEVLNQSFLAEAEKAGLVNLKGHRLVGGMRASLYNAMPPAGVKRLVDLMHDFEKRHPVN